MKGQCKCSQGIFQENKKILEVIKKLELINISNKIIKFYRSSGEFGFLSNLYRAEIEFEGMKFTSAEYAYQYGKYRNETEKEKEILKWAMSAPTGSLIAQLSHSLFSWQIKPNWSNDKINRMKNVLKAKFSQHQDLKEKLLKTGDLILIENSKSDPFWGIDKNGKGKNMLGILLMEIRNEIKINENEKRERIKKIEGSLSIL